MIYLILATLCSTLVSVAMRFSEQRAQSTMVKFMANYAVCACIALGYLARGSLLPEGGGWSFALVLGVIGGGLYLATLSLLQINIEKNGMVLSSVFMKLGVLVPILIAIIFFREMPGWLQLAGFLLALAAIVIINYSPGEEKAASFRSAGWLLVLLVAGGLTESLVNIYDKVGAANWREHFLFFIFLSACGICLARIAMTKESIALKDLLYGAMIGVPNYFSTRFLMLSLGSVPAIITYPVYNVGAIVLISLAGVLLFRERLTIRKYIGIGMILLALVMLNI